MSQTATEISHVRAHGSGVMSLYRRGLTWVSFRPLSEDACALDLSIRRLPGLGLLTGKVRGIRHEHAPAGGGDGHDDVSLHLNLTGLSIVAGRGREFELRDGDAMLLAYGVPRTITRPGAVGHAVVRFPRRVLAPLVRDLDAALLTPLRQGTGPLRLLTRYVMALAAEPALSAPGTRHLAVTHIAELLALTLGAASGAPRMADRPGLRGARLQAMKQDIELHLTDSGLSPAAVATRQGISESYLRKLFAAEGRSFSEFVLGRRLLQAHRLLGQPVRKGCSITSIALGVGFGDLSYFNRQFKRTFGLTPSERRDSAAGPDEGPDVF